MFERSKPAPSRKTPEQLAEHLADLRANEDELLRHYGDMALQAENGAGDQAAADRAHAALVSHRDAIARADALLQAVERREQVERLAAENAVADGAWAERIEKSKQRELLARRVQTRVQELGEAFAALEAANLEIQRIQRTPLPAHGVDSFALAAGLSTGMLRIEYSRHGLPGGPPLAWPAPAPIAQRYAEATAALELARSEARLSEKARRAKAKREAGEQEAA